MIIETIFSTLDTAGAPNFAPMGVVWGTETVIVKPFRNTLTYRNLAATGYGVANLSDDVLAFVQTALYDAQLPHFPASHVPGVIFQGACSWRELHVIAAGGDADRAQFTCKVLHVGRQRDFLGFCRARSAVIEATILATRCHLHSRREVAASLQQYEQIVAKTGGETERAAMELVRAFIGRKSNEDNG